MASITVATSGYWGDDSILSSGSFANLAWDDTVTINAFVKCTVDPSVRTPTGIDRGIRITANGDLEILNTSTSAALIHLGPNGSSKRLSTGDTGSVRIVGDYIEIGTGDGTANQSLSGWTTAGYDVKDEPSHVEVYNSATDEWDVWMNIAPYTLANKAGQGRLGRWFEYNTTTGAITFGNGGQPVTLSSNAASGQADIVLSDATSYSVNDWIHLIDDNGIEPHPLQITAKNSNTITVDRNLRAGYTTAANAFVRKTIGGNILPNGSAVRVYNIGIGSIDSGGARILSSNSSTSDYQLYVLNSVYCDKVYTFGFYTYLRYATSVTLKNYGLIQGVYPHSNIDIYFERVVRTCPGKYYTGLLTGIEIPSGTSTFNAKLIDCYATSYNTSCLVTSASFDPLIEGGFFVCLYRTNTAHRALNLALTIRPTIKNSLFVGHCNAGADGTLLENIQHADSMGAPDSTYEYADILSASYTSDINGLVKITEGFSNTSSNSAAGSLFRGPWRRIVNIDYYWIKGAGPRYITPVINDYSFLSNIKMIKMDDYLSLDAWGMNSAIVQKVYAEEVVNNPACVASVFRQVDAKDQIMSLYYTGQNRFFYEFRLYNNHSRGFMGLWFTKPFDSNTNIYLSKQSAIVMYASSSGSKLIIREAGEYVIFTWPHWIMGITGFPSDGTIVMDGTNEENFDLEFQYDTGSGWNGTWIELTVANLNALSVSPTGFRFKLKISHPTGSNTDNIGKLNWSTSVDYDTPEYQYPDFEYYLKLKSQNGNDLVGAQISIYDANGTIQGDLGDELAENNNCLTSEYTYTHEGDTNEIYIQIIKDGYIEQVIPFTLEAENQTVFINLVADRNE